MSILLSIWLMTTVRNSSVSSPRAHGQTVCQMVEEVSRSNRQASVSPLATQEAV